MPASNAYDLMPDRNVMDIYCGLAKKTFHLEFRMPETNERLAYDNAMTKRQGAKIKIAKDWQVVQAKMGARLCTGFELGDFSMAGKPISPVQGDPNYYADWKNLLLKKRPDLLAALARKIFGAVSEQPADVDLDDDDDAGTVEDLFDPEKFVFDDADTDTTPAAATGASEAATENPL